MAELFNEFQPVSKTEWLQKVEKDLKGKALADLQWHLSEEIQLDPFYHAADEITAVGSIAPNRNNHWEIGEEFTVQVIKESNRDILAALERGVTSPSLLLRHLNSESELYELLDGIDLSIVALHLEQITPEGNPHDLLIHYYDIVTKLGLNTAQLRGCLQCDPLLHPLDGGMPNLAKTLRFVRQYLPGWRVLHIRNPESSGDVQRVVEVLAAHVNQGIRYLEALRAEGLTVAEIAPHLQFSLEIGKSYFVEIATIRAFKVLWANVLKTYACTTYPVYLNAHLVEDTYDKNEIYTNMIRATTQAMSAVIGGVDRLTLHPADRFKETNRTLTSRVARNVQHVLQLESHLDRVQDPAAGSYYVEQLTNQLIDAVWQKL